MMPESGNSRRSKRPCASVVKVPLMSPLSVTRLPPPSRRALNEARRPVRGKTAVSALPPGAARSITAVYREKTASSRSTTSGPPGSSRPASDPLATVRTISRAPEPAASMTVVPFGPSTSSWNLASADSGVRSSVAASLSVRIGCRIAGHGDQCRAGRAPPASLPEGEFLPAGLAALLGDHQLCLQRLLRFGLNSRQQQEQDRSSAHGDSGYVRTGPGSG